MTDIEKRTDELIEQGRALNPPTYDPLKPEITYDDFAKIDLRLGTIKEASAVEGADKLVKLSVDLGFETRTIVAGIKQYYAIEGLVGRQIVVVANLAPRKLRGVESHGMLLVAKDDVNFTLLTAHAIPGASIG